MFSRIILISKFYHWLSSQKHILITTSYSNENSTWSLKVSETNFNIWAYFQNFESLWMDLRCFMREMEKKNKKILSWLQKRSRFEYHKMLESTLNHCIWLIYIFVRNVKFIPLVRVNFSAYFTWYVNFWFELSILATGKFRIGGLCRERNVREITTQWFMHYRHIQSFRLMSTLLSMRVEFSSTIYLRDWECFPIIVMIKVTMGGI